MSKSPAGLNPAALRLFLFFFFFVIPVQQIKQQAAERRDPCGPKDSGSEKYRDRDHRASPPCGARSSRREGPHRSDGRSVSHSSATGRPNRMSSVSSNPTDPVLRISTSPAMQQQLIVMHPFPIDREDDVLLGHGHQRRLSIGDASAEYLSKLSHDRQDRPCPGSGSDAGLVNRQRPLEIGLLPAIERNLAAGRAHRQAPLNRRRRREQRRQVTQPLAGDFFIDVGNLEQRARVRIATRLPLRGTTHQAG